MKSEHKQEEDNYRQALLTPVSKPNSANSESKEKDFMLLPEHILAHVVKFADAKDRVEAETNHTADDIIERYKKNPTLKLEELTSLLKNERGVSDKEIEAAKSEAKDTTCGAQYRALLPLADKYLMPKIDGKRMDVLFFLCEANPDYMGKIILIDRIHKEDKSAAWAILQFGGNFTYNIIDKGSDRSPLAAVAKKGWSDMFNYMLTADTEHFYSDELIKALLPEAIENKNIQRVTQLIDKYHINLNAFIDNQGASLLFKPSFHEEDLAMLDLLLNRGANPNGSMKFTNVSALTTNGEITERKNVLAIHPLAVSVKFANLPGIKRLLQEEKIQVNLRSTIDQVSALHIALDCFDRSTGRGTPKFYVKVIELLLAHGADPDLKNYKGVSPRMRLEERLKRSENLKEYKEVDQLFKSKMSPLFKKLDQELAKRESKEEKSTACSKLKFIFQYYVNNKPDKTTFDFIKPAPVIPIIAAWMKTLDSTKETPQQALEELEKQLKNIKIPTYLADYILYVRLNLLSINEAPSLDRPGCRP